MKAIFTKLIFIAVVFGLSSKVKAQTGPSGVNSGILLWLDATDVNATGNNPADGSSVTSWKDKSGNGNHATVLTGKQPGQVYSNQINGKSVVRFSRINITNGSGYTANGVDIRAGANPDVTIFTVYKQGEHYNQNQAIWGNDNGAWDRFFFSKWSTGYTDGGVSFGPEIAPTDPTVAVVNGAATIGKLQLLTAVYDGQVSGSTNIGPTNSSAVYFNGKIVTRFADHTHPSDAQTSMRIGLDGDDNYFNGDIAEIIVYKRKLTDCEIETVNRYLGGKYGVDFNNIADNYSWPAPFNNDINGVGNFSSSCPSGNVITTAQSSILTITNPSNTTAGNNLTFGNNRGGYSLFVDVPAGYANRINQAWRIDEKGDVGTVSVCFDMSGLGMDLSGAALLVDGDGTFSNANVVTAGKTITGNHVCFSGVSLSKGDYITLALTASSTSSVSITSVNNATPAGASFSVPTVVDDQVSVSGTTDITNTRVYIDAGFQAGDILSSGILPNGITSSYDPATGALTFSGTVNPSQWQAIFRSVTFRTTSSNTADRKIRFVLGDLVSLTVGGKPHYYEYVEADRNLSWVEANAAASARKLFGLTGYLATVTSSAENDFIKSKLSADAWVGGSDAFQQINAAKGTSYTSQAETEGQWYWVTGPEAGTLISTGNNAPVAKGYTNWAAGEPNNSGAPDENYMQFYSAQNGQWNDLSGASTPSVPGFVVEYGGFNNDPALSIDYARVLKNKPAAPVITSFTEDKGASATDNITSDPRIQINGTAIAGSSVKVFRSDIGLLGTVTTNATGSWTFDYSGTTLADGVYHFTATATVNGLESNSSGGLVITIDVTAPEKPEAPQATVTAGGYTNQARPELKGVVEANAMVTIYDKGVAIGSIMADASGDWSFTPLTALTDGTHNIVVTAADIAGNESFASDALQVIVDTQKPAAPSVVLSSSHNNGIININTPVISGAGEASAVISIYNGGVLVTTVTADGDGKWSYAFNSPIPDGVHVISTTATDAAGNVSDASTDLTITVDTQKPATPDAPVLNGGKNGYININQPTVSGTAEPGATITLYENGVMVGSANVDADGSWNYTFSPALADATYNLSVSATDAAGNESDRSEALSIHVDTQKPAAPATPVLDSRNNNGYTNINKPAISGTTESNALITIYNGSSVVATVKADASGHWSYTFTEALIDDTHLISVTATDAAGNTSDASGALPINIDTQSPATPSVPVLQGGNNGNINTRTPSISGTAEPGTTITLYDKGVSVGTVNVDADGNWNHTFSPALTEGSYNITVVAKDQAGNESAASAVLAINVDTQAPSVVVSTTAGNVKGAFSVTFTFSEPVSGFTATGVQLSNAVLSNFTMVSPSEYTASISPIYEQDVTISLNAGAAQDLANNPNITSNVLQVKTQYSGVVESVYPNPARSVVNIRFNGIVATEGRVMLTNMAGQAVHDEQLRFQNKTLTLNVSRFAAGVYVLTVRTKDYLYRTQVVIVR